jgi:hypothetical protein
MNAAEHVAAEHVNVRMGPLHLVHLRSSGQKKIRMLLHRAAALTVKGGASVARAAGVRHVIGGL